MGLPELLFLAERLFLDEVGCGMQVRHQYAYMEREWMCKQVIGRGRVCDEAGGGEGEERWRFEAVVNLLR